MELPETIDYVPLRPPPTPPQRPIVAALVPRGDEGLEVRLDGELLGTIEVPTS